MIVELNIAEDTIGIVFENAIDQGDVDTIQSEILSKLKKYKLVNLFLEEDEVEDVELSAFFDQLFFDIKHADRINKVAIVSDRTWVRGLAKLKDLLVTSDVKTFSLKRRVDAICWIMNKS